VRERVLACQVPDCLHACCAQLQTHLLCAQVHVVVPQAHHLPQAQVQSCLQRSTHSHLRHSTPVLQLPQVQQHGLRCGIGVISSPSRARRAARRVFARFGRNRPRNPLPCAEQRAKPVLPVHRRTIENPSTIAMTLPLPRLPLSCTHSTSSSSSRPNQQQKRQIMTKADAVDDIFDGIAFDVTFSQQTDLFFYIFLVIYVKSFFLVFLCSNTTSQQKRSPW